MLLHTESMGKKREQRKIIAAMVVEWCAIASRFLQARGAQTIDWNRVVVEWCVALGHLERRPMNASQISQLASIPRSTVIRMVNELIDSGIAEKQDDATYRLTAERAADASAIKSSEEACALIIKTAARLSSLDK